MARRILFISNGHGEDSIAAEVVRRLPPSVEVHAYPMIGAGRGYGDVCPIVGPRSFPPSEGVRRRGSLLRDAISGLGLRAMASFMRREAVSYDAIVVVGDLMGVLLCWLTGRRVAIYLDVYKSGYANRYSAGEQWVIRRTCDLVLTRDEFLADQLVKAGVSARFAGNVMMDALVRGGYDARARRKHAKAVAVLPGSRATAADNFALQVAALRRVHDISKIDIFAALAGPTNLEDLAEAARLRVAGDTLVADGLVIHVSTGSLGAVLEASDVVLGQAGTANLQALGLGKPVVSFFVPQARGRRRKRIAALTGDSRIVADHSPEALAAALSGLLDDEVDRARRGAIGRQRMGPPGAIAAIIEELAPGA